MDKIFILTAVSYEFGEPQMKILDVYKYIETANLDKNKAEEEMLKLRGKYNTEDIERIEDEIDNYLDENPPFDNDKRELPAHLKEFQNWLYFTPKLCEYTVTEYTLK